MFKPKISMIAAISSQNLLAKSGGETWQEQLLWKIPRDTKYFMQKTKGHVVIMGRVTFESLEKPLLNRTNIVISSNPKFIVPEGVILVSDAEEALKEAQKAEDKEIFIIGGAKIYQLFLPLADRLYLTLVDGEFEGDVFFPDYKHEFKAEISRESFDEGGYKFSFIVLER